MDKYKVTVPLSGFQVIVNVEAYDPIDARRAAIDMVMFQFPLVINNSEDFEFGGCLVGHPKFVKQVNETERIRRDFDD